jgi:hypothetical protein
MITRHSMTPYAEWRVVTFGVDTVRSPHHLHA